MYTYTRSLPYITTLQNRLPHLVRYVALKKGEGLEGGIAGRTWTRFGRLRTGKQVACGSDINETSGPIKLHAIRQTGFDCPKRAFHQYVLHFSVISHMQPIKYLHVLHNQYESWKITHRVNIARTLVMLKHLDFQTVK